MQGVSDAWDRHCAAMSAPQARALRMGHCVRDRAAYHVLLVVEEELRQGLGQLGLADAGGPQEEEAGAARLARQARPAAQHRVRHRVHRLVLACSSATQASAACCFFRLSAATSNINPLPFQGREAALQGAALGTRFSWHRCARSQAGRRGGIRRG